MRKTGADYCRPMEERNHRILYGLAHENMTQEAMAEAEGVTRQRIGAIKRRAVKRGEHPPPEEPKPAPREGGEDGGSTGSRQGHEAVGTLRSRSLEREAGRIAAGLRGIDGLEAVLLFGSVARGEADASSDCDLALVGSTRACAEAEAWAEGMAKHARLDVFHLTPENGYGGLDTWGMVGSQAIHTGRTLWGTERVRTLKEVEMKPLACEALGEQMAFILNATADAAHAWAVLRKGNAGGLKSTATRSSEAAEHLVRLACIVRGLPAAEGHTVQKMVAKALRKSRQGGRQKPRIVGPDEEGTIDYLGAMAQRLNGGGRRDHSAGYLGSRTVLAAADDGPRIGRRIGHLLQYARLELAKLAAAPGMERLREHTRGSEDELGVAAAKLASDPIEEIREGARSWPGPAAMGSPEVGRGPVR